VSASLVALALAAGCGRTSDSPMGPSVTIGTPTILSPEPFATLTGSEPTLVVANVSVTDDATPTYTFQVATDAGFTHIVAQAEGVAQGTNGETAWKVPLQLGNRRHFWRSRARVDSTYGPFSPIAAFEIAAK